MNKITKGEEHLKNKRKIVLCISAVFTTFVAQWITPMSHRAYAVTMRSTDNIQESFKKNHSKKIGNTQGNLVNAGGLLAVSDEYIYYCDDGLHKIKHDGSGKEKLTDVGMEDINVIGDWIYCRKYDDGNAYIYKMKTDGSYKTRLSNDIAFHMFVIGDWIYYKNNSDKGRLYKIDITGNNKTKICEDIVCDSFYGCDNLEGFMTVSDDYIYYYIDNKETNLYRVKVDGSDRTNLSKKFSIGFLPTQNIQVIDGWIYYEVEDGLYRVKTDGSENTKICEDAWSFNITGDYIYFMSNEDTVEKIKTDGSGRKVVSSNEGVQFFYAYGDWIYYFKNRDLQKKNSKDNYTSEITGIKKKLLFNIAKNTVFNFPDSVEVIKSDGSTEYVDIQWKNKEIDTSVEKIYEIKGNVEGYYKDIILTLNVGTINSYNDLINAVKEGKKDIVISDTYLRKSYDKAVEIVNRLIKEDMTDIEKELILHDYVVNTTIYDTENYLKGTYDITYGLYSALSEDGRAVCDGYAKAMELLLNLVGIECYYVTGDTTAGLHAWNVVKIDDSYFHLDATWDDPTGEDPKRRYNYFNLSDVEIARNHFIDEESSKKYSQCIIDRFKDLRKVLNFEPESLKNQDYYRDNQYIYYIMDKSLNKININSGESVQFEEGNILRMTVYGEWIYYVVQDECYNTTLYKIRKDGSQKRKLSKLPNEQVSVDYIISDGKALYMSINDWETEKIIKMGLNNNSVKTISNDGAANIVLYKNWIFYSNKSQGRRIYKIKKDGSEKTKVTDKEAWNLKTKNEYLHYNTGHSICKFHASSQKSEQLTGDRIAPIWLTEEYTTLMGDYIYYSNGSDWGKLYRLKKDGTGRKVIDNEDNHGSIREINNDQQYIYYTNYSTELFKSDCNGENIKKLVGNFTSDMVLDSKWVYYIGDSEDYFYRLFRVNKNGKNIEQLTEKEVGNFKVSNNYIYYNTKDDKFCRMDKDGRNKIVISDNEINNYCVNGNNVFYSRYNDKLFNCEIIKVDERGKEHTIYHDDYIAENFYFIGNSIYYNGSGYNFYRINIDDIENRKLICNAYISPNKGKYVDVCEDYIYFKDSFDRSIYRINKDGNNLIKISGSASHIIGSTDKELYYVSNIKEEKLKLK